MSRFIASRIRIATLLLFVPGLGLGLSMMAGCGSEKTDNGTVSTTTSQAEEDQIQAEMRSNETAAQ